jgi:hypothetical protein
MPRAVGIMERCRDFPVGGDDMRRALTAAAVMTLALAGPAWAGTIRFSKDYASSMARAKREGKPVALFFTADW